MHPSQPHAVYQSLPPPQQHGYTPAGNTTSQAPRYPYPSITLGNHELVLQRIHYQVDVQVCTAFVHLTATYLNQTGTRGDCVFNLPMSTKGTIICANVTIGSRIIETQVISQDDAQQLASKNPPPSSQKQNHQTYDKYVPDVFHLPFQNIQPNDTLVVTASYFEPLQYQAGKYTLCVPVTIKPQAFPSGVYMSQLLSFQIVLNAGITNSLIEVPSHPTVCPERSDYRMVINGNHSVDWNNRDIIFSYSAWSPVITATLLAEAPNPANYDPRLSFMLFLSPPQTIGDMGYFGRSVVFLLDRSGSMSGDPMNQARRSVLYGLDHLREVDVFTIIAFDDQQVSFYNGLLQANPANIQSAKQWVNQVNARGGTDIQVPLQQALQLVGTYPQFVPFVFLITDGAVSNERDICRFVHDIKSPARICTFGIGPYCNAYFLKMLAILGRGFSDVALNSNMVFDQISHLFEMANLPALTNVEVGVSTGNCEIYPFPIPDLFIGAPLVVTGKYDGAYIDQIVVRGTLSNGTVWTQVVNPIVGHQVPVNKVFVKQRLDMMTAKCWLEDDLKLKKEIVNLSVHESMPSAHTCMVAYETTSEKKAKGSKDKGKSQKNSDHTREIVAGLAIGGVVILGVAMTQFGDIGATLSNLSVLDAMSSIDLGNVLSGVGDLASGIGDGIGNAVSGAGDALQGDCCGGCGDCGDCMDCGFCGDLFGTIGSCCGDVCGGIGDCLDSCDGCDSVCDVLCCIFGLLGD